MTCEMCDDDETHRVQAVTEAVLGGVDQDGNEYAAGEMIEEAAEVCPKHKRELERAADRFRLAGGRAEVFASRI